MNHSRKRYQITATTDLYRGAAHNNFNLKYQISDHIPIVFHNLRGYDTHLFMKKLGKKFNKKKKEKNKEKNITINVKINVKLAGGVMKTVRKYVKIFSLSL